MALIADPATWFANTLVTAPLLKTQMTDPINAFNTAAPGGFLGDANSASNVTLSTTNDFAGLAVVTFTLATQRRIRIDTVAQFAPAGAVAATYTVQSGYNSGSSATIGSVTKIGKAY